MIRIGISGWRYQPWRGVFYPEGLPQRRELEFAARHFPTVEINGSFYSLQRPQYYEDWYAASKEAAKVSSASQTELKGERKKDLKEAIKKEKVKREDQKRQVKLLR